MKKYICLILSFVVLFLTSCAKSEEIVDIPNEEEIGGEVSSKPQFPKDFSFEGAKITVEEIIETKNIEFNEGKTTVKLNNNRGKYIRVNYSLSNNEAYDIDMDHSVEVIIVCKGEMLYGEYYENKTGKEQLAVAPGEKKDISFICDVDGDADVEKIVFEYKNKSLELEL